MIRGLMKDWIWTLKRNKMTIDKNKIIQKQPVALKQGIGCSLVFVFLFLLLSSFAFSQKYVHVSRVIDGDTFMAENTYYRIAEIDAPELNQLYGEESADFLRTLIQGREVRIHFQSRDIYFRKIVKVYFKNTLLSEILISNGCAWWYKKYSTNQKLRKLEIHARKNKKGLWQKPAIEPWLYRKYK